MSSSHDSDPPPTSIQGHGFAPLEKTRAHHLDTLFGSLLWWNLVGGDFNDALQTFCTRLATQLSSAVVMLSRRDRNGIIKVVASSSESLLWSALRQLPEQDDSHALCAGPAARALRKRASVTLHVNEEGFAPWRGAAEQDRIRACTAWPVNCRGGDWALLVFSADESELAESEFQVLLSQVAICLQICLDSIEQLREQRRLANALEGAGNAAFMASLSGDIVWCNQAFSELSGWSRKDAVGNNPQIPQSGHQGLRYYRRMWNSLDAGIPWQEKNMDRNCNGELYTVQQTISPVFEDGRIAYYLGIQNDISRGKEREARQEWRESNDTLSGLPTPTAFEQSVDLAIAEGDAFSLTLVSVQPLWSSIVVWGVMMENQVIVELARRIRKVLQPPCDACLLKSGDYLLFVPHQEDGTDPTATTLDRLRTALTESVSLRGNTVQVGFRTGTARHPESGQTFDDLLKAADQQLMAAKRLATATEWQASIRFSE